MLFQSSQAMSNEVVVLNTAYPGNPIIQSHVHLYVCYTNNHIRTCKGEKKCSVLSSEEKAGELEEITAIFIFS